MTQKRRTRNAITAILACFCVLVCALLVAPTGVVQAQTQNLARGKNAVANGSEAGHLGADKAVDGDTTSG